MSEGLGTIGTADTSTGGLTEIVLYVGGVVAGTATASWFSGVGNGESEGACVAEGVGGVIEGLMAAVVIGPVTEVADGDVIGATRATGAADSPMTSATPVPASPAKPARPASTRRLTLFICTAPYADRLHTVDARQHGNDSASARRRATCPTGSSTSNIAKAHRNGICAPSWTASRL